MRSLILFSIIFIAHTGAFAQLHNRLIKVNVGYSGEQFDHRSDIKAYNDTSNYQFDFVSKSPVVSYTHAYIISEKLSISGKVGFQYMNIYYDHQYYGSPFVFGSINPTLSLFYTGKFEYYVKLQVGVNYWFNNPHLLPDIAQRIFPEGANFYTGVTLGGFNYYFTNSLGANLELSIWSPELLTLGLSYRFYKGSKPTIQDLQQL